MYQSKQKLLIIFMCYYPELITSNHSDFKYIKLLTGKQQHEKENY